MKRYDAEFPSDGLVLRGWLFVPDGPGPHPAVVMSHGFVAVKEGFLHHDFPGVFAEAGLMALVFDHPNCGTSDGVPRGELDPIGQQRAYRDAISFLLTRPDVDSRRIAIWGTSYSGGHVLAVAAYDPRVRCVVAQVPMISGGRNMRRRNSSQQLAEMRQQWAEDRVLRLRGELPARVKPLGEKNLFSMLPPEFAVNWRNDITAHTQEMYFEYEPGDLIHRISPRPLLMIVATEDTTTFTDDELAAFQRAGAPKALVMIPGDHYSVYFECFGMASGAARDWLKSILNF